MNKPTIAAKRHKYADKDLRTADGAIRQAAFYPARPEQTALIRALYRAAAKNMNAQGVFQWNDAYPSEAIIAADIAEGTLFLLETEDGLAGAVVLNQDCEPDGAGWDECVPAAYIHRLAVHPAYQGRGIGGELIRRGESLSRTRGCVRLRLMVGEANAAARALYERAGFIEHRRLRLGEHGVFVFMEKAIE